MAVRRRSPRPNFRKTRKTSLNSTGEPWPRRLHRSAQPPIRLLEALQPAALLGARSSAGWTFFAAGLTKLRDRDTTLALFADEYRVALLTPELAAAAATAGELELPVLLVAGLAGRFATAGLSVVDIVVVISLAEIAPAALQQHPFWGSLLIAVLRWGPGRWSLDVLLAPRLVGKGG